jgi:Myb-like DNA-binding domain
MDAPGGDGPQDGYNGGGDDEAWNPFLHDMFDISPFLSTPAADDDDSALGLGGGDAQLHLQHHAPFEAPLPAPPPPAPATTDDGAGQSILDACLSFDSGDADTPQGDGAGVRPNAVSIGLSAALDAALPADPCVFDAALADTPAPAPAAHLPPAAPPRRFRPQWPPAQGPAEPTPPIFLPAALSAFDPSRAAPYAPYNCIGAPHHAHQHHLYPPPPPPPPPPPTPPPAPAPPSTPTGADPLPLAPDGRQLPGRRTKKARNKARKWSAAEQARFEYALETWGRDWEACARHVGTRDISLIRSHAQKHFIKLYKTGRPLPRRVADSGLGYTLSGNALRDDSPSARSYLTGIAAPPPPQQQRPPQAHWAPPPACDACAGRDGGTQGGARALQPVDQNIAHGAAAGFGDGAGAGGWR